MFLWSLLQGPLQWSLLHCPLLQWSLLQCPLQWSLLQCPLLQCPLLQSADRENIRLNFFWNGVFLSKLVYFYTVFYYSVVMCC